ncbi:MAG: glycosyltransferase, partial [Candidatus Omnitrophica bacterium]|nr:glycosyltransferase [Candidatus Omnitrophota bacterium]
MKTITFDARMASHPGIGRYIRSLLKEMVTCERYRFKLIGNPCVLDPFKPHAEIVPCDLKIYGLKGLFASSGFYRGADLIHIPHFNVPFNLKAPFVATIHDLIHFEFEEYKPFPGALFMLRLQLNRIFKNAAGIIAVSEATRQSCVRMFNASESSIQVIYEAAEENLTSQQSRPDGFESSRYILCVGSVREHKNIHGILSAYEYIRRERPEVKLVILGKLDPRFESKHQFLKKVSENPDIVHIANADDKE